MQCRFPSADVTPQCLSGSYSRVRSPFLSGVDLLADTEPLLLLLLLLLQLLLPFPLVVLLEDDDDDDEDEEEEEDEGSLLELLRFPPFPDGDALMDEAVLLSLLTPEDEVDDEEEPFLSRAVLDDVLAVAVAAETEPEDSCFELA